MIRGRREVQVGSRMRCLWRRYVHGQTKGKEERKQQRTKTDLRLFSSSFSTRPQIHSLIASHFGEAIIRTRFTDYLQRFIRLTSRYEEETYGPPSPSGLRTWYPTLPCDPKRGRLGSGAVLWDGELWLGGEGNTEGRRRESEGAGSGFVALGLGTANGERRTVKEFVGGNGVRRMEGWRASKSYELWREVSLTFYSTTIVLCDEKPRTDMLTFVRTLRTSTTTRSTARNSRSTSFINSVD